MLQRLKAALSPSSPAIPAVTDPLQRKVIERCQACYQDAEHLLKRRFPRPEISFKLRGKSAGTAHLQQNRLRFNPVLLAENPEAFLCEVVPHEVAHLLCFQLYGTGKHIKPHGQQWQAIMRQVFNLAPRASHNFDISSVKGQTFTYQCQCGPVELTVRRHNKVQRGESRYLCRQCRQLLSRRTD
ncbi:SprT family zinc-dependent metalloprotease [Shewanella sp. GXUN23E]|uniref:SprT family zinc-dependent metalloprotease n=1 Tax=Shewanella sp. GXUN23E TaxID=3422498 RepID=UPI003D7ED8C1